MCCIKIIYWECIKPGLEIGFKTYFPPLSRELIWAAIQKSRNLSLPESHSPIPCLIAGIYVEENSRHKQRYYEQGRTDSSICKLADADGDKAGPYGRRKRPYGPQVLHRHIYFQCEGGQFQFQQ